MRTKTFAFRAVLIALLLAALACNAVTNAISGNADDRVEDAQATADALSTEAAEVFDDLDDPLGEATAEGEEPVDEEPVDEATPEDEEPSDDPDVPGLGGDGPDDVPVMDASNEDFFASADVVTYLADAPYADVVAFYRAEMEAAGWTYDANLSTEFGEIAALTYNKDNRTATVS